MIDKDDEKIEHPSFGMIRVSRVSGHADLFGVDFPQQHYITLTIEGGVMYRSLSNDWFMGKGEKIQIAMSETQYAKMISTPNTSGTPCTIQRAVNMETGEYELVPPPPKHMADTAKFHEELKAKGAKAVENVTNARKMINDMLSGGSLTKGKLQEIAALLASTEQEVVSNISFRVQQAEEAVTAAETNAKAEIDAYVQHTMAELGRDTFRQAIADGQAEGRVMLRIGGRKVSPGTPAIEPPLVESTDD